MLTLFFVNDLPKVVGSSYEFGGEDAGHAIRVLRTQAGDSLALSDGQGTWSIVQVKAVDKKSMSVEVTQSGFEEALPVEFTVAQALTKGDRIKESIELNTEQFKSTYNKDTKITDKEVDIENTYNAREQLFSTNKKKPNEICRNDKWSKRARND
jgi:hypothetical protein